jgi:hypothetical protein
MPSVARICFKRSKEVNMPDHTRAAATEKPVYSGVFRPRFFDGEQFCALGFRFDDLVENAGWFQTLPYFRKSLDEARSVILNRSRPPLFKLDLRKEGMIYGDRCNLAQRIPMEWPAHSLLKTLLLASPTTEDTQVKAAKTFEQQLKLLAAMPGWTDTYVTGTINEAFEVRLTNALELLYFGVDAAKARASYPSINNLQRLFFDPPPLSLLPAIIVYLTSLLFSTGCCTFFHRSARRARQVQEYSGRAHEAHQEPIRQESCIP